MAKELNKLSVTRGGPNKSKRFDWKYDTERKTVQIRNEDGKAHEYSIDEIQSILQELITSFKEGFFPLGNNVEKLANGTERQGLGTIILEQKPGDIYHAQGSSYLGVVLEECGYLQWNGKHRGIKWRIVNKDFDKDVIANRLSLGNKS